MKRPLFAPIGPNTVMAFMISVPMSFFLVALVFFALQAVGSGVENFAAITTGFFSILIGSLVVGAVMLIPAFLFGMPLYKFIKGQIGIKLWTCLLFGGVVSVLAPFLLLVFSGEVFHPVLLLFGVPGLIAGFLFHRVDQGFWFRAPPIVRPEDVF